MPRPPVRKLLLVTHPRSGTTWTSHRVSTLAKVMREAGRRYEISMPSSHGGFHPVHPIEGRPQAKDFPVGEPLTILRDAQKSIVSTWFWLKKNKHHYSTMELDDYVREIGIPKYLNCLKMLRSLDLKHVFYYEDVQTPNWYKEFCEVFDIPFSPTPEQCEYMHELDKEPAAVVGTDHSQASPELLAYIRRKISTTPFEPYRRYIEEWRLI